MLSKAERNYLSGKISPSFTHKRVLEHRIKKKFDKLLKSELPLIQNSSVTEIRNYVTKFSNDVFHYHEKLKVPEGVEPPCISFAGSRITVLPEYHFEKHELNN
jgi:hypothetical protein